MAKSDEPSPISTAVLRRRVLRWGLVLVAGLVVSGVGVVIAVRNSINARYLEQRLDRTLRAATARSYDVEIGAVHWGPLAQTVRVVGLKIHSDSQVAPRPANSEGEGGRQYHVSVPEVQLSGIHPWPLLRERTLVLSAVHLHGPVVRVRGEGKSKSQAPPADSGRPQGQRESFLQDVSVHRLQIKEGVVSRNGGRGGTPRDSLWGLSLRFDSLSTESDLRHRPTRYLERRFSQAAIQGYRRAFPEALYHLRLGPSRVSRRTATLRARSIHLAPSVPDSTFMERHEYRTNRYRIAVGEVRVSGFDVRRFLSGQGYRADALRLDSLRVNVYRDNHLPPRPEDPPPLMPHELVEQVDRSFRIDTVRVQGGAVRYVKRPEKVSRPGSISFEDLWASLYNVTNDPQRMTPSTPAVLDARTAVNGAGVLRTTLRVPLLSPHLSLSYEGRLGPMDARAFNETFVPLGGVRIETGEIDSLWFQATVNRGTASGKLRSVYRNLEVETLDPTTGERGLRDRLETLVVDGLALRSKNRPSGEPMRVGQIRHAHQSDNSFFKFLWLSLRSGMYSLVGIDRLPR